MSENWKQIKKRINTKLFIAWTAAFPLGQSHIRDKKQKGYVYLMQEPLGMENLVSTYYCHEIIGNVIESEHHH